MNTMTTQNTQAQDQSKWFYLQQFPYNAVQWTENGRAAINKWDINGPFGPGPILTLTSTSPLIQPSPTFLPSPASLRFISESFVSDGPLWLAANKFAHNEIDFWSTSTDVTWLTGKIKTVDCYSGQNPDYTYTDLTQQVKAGLAFYSADGPTLNEALSGIGVEVFRIAGGNMGVGSKNPVQKFEVQTDPIWTGTKISIDQDLHNNPSIRMYRSTGFPNCDPDYREAHAWWMEINNNWQEYGTYGALHFKSTTQAICPNGSEEPLMLPKVVFTAEGNVGIGVTNPLQKLVVDGMICSKEARVSVDGAPCWPDYVFDDDYALTDLNELEKFVKQNRHLPGIPSAEEVVANGIELGAFQAKLLKKIEELTLYVIELKKENEEIKEKFTKVMGE